MHKFMRAIGFSGLSKRKEIQVLVTDVIVNADERKYTSKTDESVVAEFSKDYAENMGLAVCGEFDEDNNFTYDYYYPYLRGSGVSSQEDVSVERHAANESYAGVCDDIKVGVSLIFYLQDMVSYVKAQSLGKLPIRGTSLTLSGLSIHGMILMPIEKNEKDKLKTKKAVNNRNQLIAAARQGDEEAIETLTLEDMDMYTAISKKIHNEDLFSLVDTYFMPYGVECDQYSVLGEITDYQLVTNRATQEKIYILTINSNELTFDVCINIIDLLGEPKVGRRFKGTVWLQGMINYPDQA